jgi:hypothetical protein
MKTIDKMILQMAKELGDPKGCQPDTIDYISMELQISYGEVAAVFRKKVR